MKEDKESTHSCINSNDVWGYFFASNHVQTKRMIVYDNICGLGDLLKYPEDYVESSVSWAF